MNEKLKDAALKPAVYFNYKLKQEGKKPTRIVEYPLYTDACKIESSYSCLNNPYKLINPDVITTKNICLPRIILQFEEFDYSGRNVTRGKTFYSDFYLINNIPDQIAVFLSLILGIRIRAGNESRNFNNTDLDKGTPLHRYINLDPAQIKLIKNNAIIPAILKNTDNKNGFFTLNAVDAFFSSFFSLNANQAALIIRAAKLYRDALWIVDSEPQLSLILLISAIEVLSEDIGINNLELSKKHSNFCEKCKKECKNNLSKRKKFLNFLVKHLPDPPAKRCCRENQLNWEDLKKCTNKNPLIEMYRFRSKFLHDGIPFPLDFLKPISFWSMETDDTNRYEKSVTTLFNNQLVELSPMSISIFEYIVRHAILDFLKQITQISFEDNKLSRLNK